PRLFPWTSTGPPSQVGVLRPMKTTQARTTNSKTPKNDFGRFWAAAIHIGECSRRGLPPTSRAPLAPFVVAALDLALATLANPTEDPEALVERVRVSGDVAVKVLPSLKEVLDERVSPAKAEQLCRSLVRHARTI